MTNVVWNLAPKELQKPPKVPSAFCIYSLIVLELEKWLSKRAKKKKKLNK